MALLKARQLANILGVSRQSINFKAQKGVIPSTKLIIGKKNYYRFDLEAILADKPNIKDIINMDANKKTLTVTQISKTLNLSRETVYKLIKDNHIKTVDSSITGKTRKTLIYEDDFLAIYPDLKKIF